MKPAPLDVRVARVVVPPLPFAAYFLIRVPQVTEGQYVPWAEAVPIILLTAVATSLWLYWIADLIAWFRDRPTSIEQPSPLELTTDLSDHGVFEGDLVALIDAEAKGRPVPPRTPRFRDVVLRGARAFDQPRHTATNYFVQAKAAARHAAELDATFYALGARRGLDGGWIVEIPNTDDRPTEPLLLTHEFTPASGVRMEVERTGRHRRVEPVFQPLPPPTDDNADAYAQLNRTRELPFS